MGRINIAITAILCLFLTSCMAEHIDGEIIMANGYQINGRVLDQEENPIPHIKVTLEWKGQDSPIVIYTSDKGIFYTIMDNLPDTYPFTIDITLEDIDGERNNGLYESESDQITIPEENDNKIIDPVYHLTLSTASENSPQS